MADSDPHSEEYFYDSGRALSGDTSPPRKNKRATRNHGKSQTIEDDPLSGFMQLVNPSGADTPPLRTVVYNYDGAGNRTSVGDTLFGNVTYTPNALNQYDTLTGSTIHHGNNHEIDQYQGPADPQPVTYTYVNDEHLKSASVSGTDYNLFYDALGRCVKRKVSAVQGGSTTYFLYDGEKPILEFNQDGQLAKNVYGKGIDEILMRTDPSVNGGAAFYYQQDHEGSVTHLINAVGNKIEQYRYDVFGGPFVYDGSGNPRPGGTAYKNRFLFTGREYMSTFGLYEYRTRAYHPGLGRFMSEDHKLGDTGDYNLFRYCHNDPVDFTDPMGLSGDAGGGAKIDTSSIERLIKYEQSKELFGAGAIEIGRLRNAISQLAETQLNRINVMLSAIHAKMGRSFINREGRNGQDLSDTRLLAVLENNKNRMNSSNVAKMGWLNYRRFQLQNNSAATEFYHKGWYSYQGSIDALHGTWLSHEINYLVIGQAAAAHHETLGAMDSLINAYVYGRQAVRGVGPAGGEWLWARVGYTYLYANRALEGGY